MNPTPQSPQDPEPADAPIAVQSLVTVVIDRSGSMGPLRGPVVEGVNQLIMSLEPSDRVTIVQFDSHDPYEVLIDAMPAAEITTMAYEQYQPRGGTPLFDAVGIAIARTAGQAREMEILNGAAPNVVLAIVTDGHENASREYTGGQVARLIEHSRNDGWTITYAGIGMGDDAFAEARRIGVDADRTTSWAYNPEGTGLAFRAITDSVDDSRAMRMREERRRR